MKLQGLAAVAQPTVAHELQDPSALEHVLEEAVGVLFRVDGTVVQAPTEAITDSYLF